MEIFPCWNNSYSGILQKTLPLEAVCFTCKATITRIHLSSVCPFTYLPSERMRAWWDREPDLPLMVSHVRYSREEWYVHTKDLETNNFSLNQNVFLQIFMLNKHSVRCTGGPGCTRTPNNRGPKKATCSRASQLSGSVSIGWSLKAVEMRELRPFVEEWLGGASGLWAGSQGSRGGTGLGCLAAAGESKVGDQQAWKYRNADFTEQLLPAVRLFPGGSFMCWDCQNEIFSQFPVRGKLKKGFVVWFGVKPNNPSCFPPKLFHKSEMLLSSQLHSTNSTGKMCFFHAFTEIWFCRPVQDWKSIFVHR